MKFPSIKNSITALVFGVIILSVSSCVKDKFPAPNGSNADPVGLYPTMTINQFKLNYYIPNQNNPFPFQITDSVILSGVIIGDDRSGNIYKTLIFQDSAGGGIQIVVDQTALYNTFPVGTRIFVKCKGLYLYNYAGTLELGAYKDTTKAQPSLGGIPFVNLSQYVVKGKTGLTVTPKHWNLFTLTNGADQINDQSTLIQVDSVEFTNPSLSMTYADAINKASGNVTLQDTAKPTPNTVVVRSSGFANFATQNPPSGFGSVTGIFTIYVQSNGTANNQITIRDTSDVKLYSARRP